jgi:hypothetical protein
MGLVFMNNNDIAYNARSAFCNQKSVHNISKYKNFDEKILKSVSQKRPTKSKALTKANRLFLETLGYHVVKTRV